MTEWTLMLGLALGFAVLMCAAVFQVAKDLEWERDQDRREAKRLRKVVASLVMDRAEWQAKAMQYRDLLNDVAEDHAMDREYEAWKSDMDPALATMTPEQMERMLAAIFAPVRPAPASWSTVEELTR